MYRKILRNFNAPFFRKKFREINQVHMRKLSLCIKHAFVNQQIFSVKSISQYLNYFSQKFRQSNFTRILLKSCLFQSFFVKSTLIGIFAKWDSRKLIQFTNFSVKSISRQNWNWNFSLYHAKTNLNFYGFFHQIDNLKLPGRNLAVLWYCQ